MRVFLKDHEILDLGTEECRQMPECLASLNEIPSINKQATIGSLAASSIWANES